MKRETNLSEAVIQEVQNKPEQVGIEAELPFFDSFDDLGFTFVVLRHCCLYRLEAGGDSIPLGAELGLLGELSLSLFFPVAPPITLPKARVKNFVMARVIFWMARTIAFTTFLKNRAIFLKSFLPARRSFVAGTSRLI